MQKLTAGSTAISPSSKQNLQAAYEKRLAGPLPHTPTADTLRELQRRHMSCVAFENIDVFLDRKIDLSREALFSKILDNPRGGYCFELNTLYAYFLESLGYSVSKHLGRVWLRDPEDTPPRNHLTLIVKLNGKRVLTDVGFGARAARQPLDIDSEQAVDDGDGLVRVISLNDAEKMVQRKQDGAWQNQYSFELVEATQADVKVANHYMATHPDSHFRHDLFVGIFREDGRIGLWNGRLTRRVGEHLDVSEVDSLDEWLAVADQQFGIKISLGDEDRHRFNEALLSKAV